MKKVYSHAHTHITDGALDQVVNNIKQHHPNDGERLLTGHLTRCNIFVLRTRVRASIHRVDPEGTAIRRSITVRRRVYRVEGPNALWHIDGHHKLIRWRFVIHGSIDGYSRVSVYLKCDDNNRASTVLNCFSEAVTTHGLPQKIRSDLGGENVDVWQYMFEQHSDTDVVTTGSSTHNKRIERLWRDVYRCVGVLYHDAFRSLEENEKLDPLNEIDIFCLHYVFLPLIKNTLQSFVESWNNRALSTENNLTPNQLFIRGAIQHNVMPVIPHSPEQNAGILHNSSSERVTVPRINFIPCLQLKTRLESQLNPFEHTSDLGCSLYMVAVRIVGRHLQNCADCA